MTDTEIAFPRPDFAGDCADEEIADDGVIYQSQMIYDRRLCAILIALIRNTALDMIVGHVFVLAEADVDAEDGETGIANGDQYEWRRTSWSPRNLIDHLPPQLHDEAREAVEAWMSEEYPPEL